MKATKTDEKYMRRCIQLALNAKGSASPNPMVGAVIVWKDKIIGEGYHIRSGEPHAEVNAIRSVSNHDLLKESTIYVSLEPCSHYGKTPPCADLIIEKGIPRVVIGCQDPFEKVCGGGIAKLIAAGIEVTLGCLEKECKELNKRFIRFHTLKRPYIILKWAESSDGYIDRVRGMEELPTLISTPETQMIAHKLRSEVDAIMVGGKTAIMDNPSLTTRQWAGSSPLRIVLKGKEELPNNLKLLTDNKETIIIPPSAESIKNINELLFNKGIQSLLVEGGSKLLTSYIENDLWDEIHIEHGEIQIGKGIPSPILPKGYRSIREKKFGHYYTILRR